MTHDMNIYIYVYMIYETNVDNGSTKPYNSWVSFPSLSPPNGADWADHGRASTRLAAHPKRQPPD